MCHFITIALPTGKAELLERNIPRGLHISPTANEMVLQRMGPGIRTYLLMSGGCSCDLFNELPSNNEEDRTDKSHSEHARRRKYEKRGWSAAKIDRALREHAAGSGSTAQSFSGLRGDVQRFLGGLATNVGRLAVLVHWYDGDVENERFTCKEGEVIVPQVALEEQLRLPSDEIVWIEANTKNHSRTQP